MKRSGLITTKIGMTRLYDDAGAAHAVTVLAVGDCTVIGNRTADKNGYIANIVGMREAKAKHIAKPQAVAAEKAGVKPFRKVVEFRVSDDCIIPAGTALSAEHFVAGQFVDVQATSKGKGFQGVVKRHGFGGVGQTTHGQHNRLRAPGSIGACSYPAKVFKGMRMAGQMGNKQVTVQNLQVLKVIPENNVLVIKGSIPGSKGSIVVIEK